MHQNMIDYLDWYLVPIWGEPPLVHVKVFRTWESAVQEYDETAREFKPAMMTDGPILGKRLLSCLADTGVTHVQIVFHNDPVGNS